MNEIKGYTLVPDKALCVLSQTAVGFHYARPGYPRPDGNCFSVKVSGHREIKIVNFCVENIYEVVRRGVKWPINMLVIDASNAGVIHDPRIPEEWYADEFCHVCCPVRYLPAPQQLARALRIEQGVLVERGRIEHYDMSKQIKLEDPDGQADSGG